MQDDAYPSGYAAAVSVPIATRTTARALPRCRLGCVIAVSATLRSELAGIRGHGSCHLPLARDDAIVVVLVARSEAVVATLEDRVTSLERRVDSMEADAKVHFAELRQFIGEHFQALEGRFQALEGRFQALEGRIQALEGRFQALEIRMDQRFDAHDRRIGALEWKVNWLVLPALGVILVSMIWLALAS
jgi:hypothetical protein